MSFNILFENAPPTNWNIRRPLVTSTINMDNPDIIGMQEVQSSQYIDLQTDLAANYTVYRPSNPSTFLGNAIAYRTSRFTELAKGMFTYSATPDVQGTDFFDNTNSRYAAWMTLMDNVTNKSVFIVSTHFYSPGEQTNERFWSAQILMGRIQNLAAGLPIIVAGDFNMRENHTAYAAITQADKEPLTDTYRALNSSNPSIEGTVHGDTTTFPASTSSGRIDYIFSAYMNILDAEILHTHFDGQYPSDHFPITAKFTYGNVITPDPNIINPGGIFGGASFSDTFGAQLLTNAQIAFGGCSSASIEYQWQYRKKDVCATTWPAWNDTTGATNASSSWSGDTKDVQFRRGAKRSDCGTWQYSNSITMNINTQITDPGQISGDVQACGFVNPAAMVSVTDASGGCGELEYMFQVRNKLACAVDWDPWTNATGVLSTPTGYDPGNWDRDREIRRGARRVGFTDFIWSNSVNIDVYLSGAADPACNCATLNIEAHSINQVQIYPNPASSFIHIEIAKKSTIKNISIYSLLGQKMVLNKNNDKNLPLSSDEIDIQNLKPGIYIIKVETDGFITNKKIIVE